MYRGGCEASVAGEEARLVVYLECVNHAVVLVCCHCTPTLVNVGDGDIVQLGRRCVALWGPSLGDAAAWKRSMTVRKRVVCACVMLLLLLCSENPPSCARGNLPAQLKADLARVRETAPG